MASRNLAELLRCLVRGDVECILVGRFRAAQKQIISKPGMYFCWVSDTFPTTPNALQKDTPRFVRLPNLSNMGIRPLARPA